MHEQKWNMVKFYVQIFQAINRAFLKEKSDFPIGVLDIYGFEIFEVIKIHGPGYYLHFRLSLV